MIPFCCPELPFIVARGASFPFVYYMSPSSGVKNLSSSRDFLPVLSLFPVSWWQVAFNYCCFFLYHADRCICMRIFSLLLLEHIASHACLGCLGIALRTGFLHWNLSLYGYLSLCRIYMSILVENVWMILDGIGHWSGTPELLIVLLSILSSLLRTSFKNSCIFMSSHISSWYSLVILLDFVRVQRYP